QSGRVRVSDGWWSRRDGWLGAWVAQRRAEYHAGKLPLSRVQALESVPGWAWGEPEEISGELVTSGHYEQMVLERIAELGRERPEPASELLVPAERPRVHWRQKVPLPPFADWIVHEYLPPFLERVGFRYHAVFLRGSEPIVNDRDAESATYMLDEVMEDLKAVWERPTVEEALARRESLLGYWEYVDRAAEVVMDSVWSPTWNVHPDSWPELRKLVRKASSLALRCMALEAWRHVARLHPDPRVIALSRMVGWARRGRRDGGSAADYLYDRYFLEPEARIRAVGTARERTLVQVLHETERAHENARRDRPVRRRIAHLAASRRVGTYLRTFQVPNVDETRKRSRGGLPKTGGKLWRPVAERLAPRDRQRVATARWRKRVTEDWFRRLPGARRRWILDSPRVDERWPLVVEQGGWWSSESAPPDAFTFYARRTKIDKGQRKVAFLNVPRGIELAQDRAMKLSGFDKVLRGATLLVARACHARAAADGMRRYEAVWLRRSVEKKGTILKLEQGLLIVRDGTVIRVETVEEPGMDRLEKLGFPGLQVAPAIVRWERRAVPWDALPPEPLVEAPPPPPVSRTTGSPARSVMPDGSVVEDRDERFAFNVAAARAYHEAHGHLRPGKKDRPNGVNLYQWLKNQELQIRQGTIPPERLEIVTSLPGWEERQTGTVSIS
ncbi:MAG TPA: helicase associated domain-containing protein, partial [Longimicrobium sp.]|nr:helicase associated domain-containing protein [Longimicrobium sp.]